MGYVKEKQQKPVVANRVRTRKERKGDEQRKEK